jgi:hypothetical protein
MSVNLYQTGKRHIPVSAERFPVSHLHRVRDEQYVFVTVGSAATHPCSLWGTSISSRLAALLHIRVLYGERLACYVLINFYTWRTSRSLKQMPRDSSQPSVVPSLVVGLNIRRKWVPCSVESICVVRQTLSRYVLSSMFHGICSVSISVPVACSEQTVYFIIIIIIIIIIIVVIIIVAVDSAHK